MSEKKIKKQSKDVRIVIRLKDILFRYWDRILLGVISSFLVTAADGIAVGILAKVIDVVDKAGNYINKSTDVMYRFFLHYKDIVFFDRIFTGKAEIYKLIIYMVVAAIAITIFKGFFTYGRTYGYRSLIQKTLMFIRNRIYEKLIILPVSYYDNNRTGEMMSRTTTDVDNLKESLLGLLGIVLDGIQAVFYVIILLFINWQLTLFAGLILPFMAYMLKRFGKPIRKANVGIVDSVAKMIIFLQETLQGIRIIKIFSREADEANKFQGLAKNNYSANMRETRLSTILKPINDVLAVFGFMSVLLFLAWQMLYLGNSLGSVVAYVALLNFAYKPLKNISGFNDSYQRTMASAGRIFELIDLEDEYIHQPHKPAALPEITGSVRLENVSFGYTPEKYVLSDISMHVDSGKTLAIVGPSGSGKSTLVNLIPLFYYDYTGRILLDGVDIKSVKIPDLRKHIAVVPQDTVLFSGTIFDNIRYAKPDASQEQVELAAQQANAHNFIARLKNGYKTEIGERGVQLSGGEKQRISIARALLKDPRVLILDEATSALDTESEHLVQQALVHLMLNRTTLVIAHRLSTIKHADHIVVIEKGSIVEEGTHSELYAKENGLYRKLCQIQFEMNK